MPERLPSRRIARGVMACVMVTAGLLASAAGADAPSAPRAAPSSQATLQSAPPMVQPSSAPLPPLSKGLDPILLDLGVQLGPSFRLGDAPAFAVTERSRLSFAARAFVTPSRYFSLGLAYEHVGLGREQSGDGAPNFVDVTRSLDAVWAGLRPRLFGSPRFTLALNLGVGLVFQHATVRAVLASVGGPPSLIQCSGSEALNFAFRAGLGADIMIGKGFFLLTDVLLDNVRLSSDALDDCVTGAGTTSLFSTRLGVAYQFDVSRFLR